jgi:hypothetical protein
MTTIPDAATIGVIIDTAVKAASDSTPRTMQSAQGFLGPSDIGFCRNKAALMMKGKQQTDSKSAWAANVGTAIHAWVEDALKAAFPAWLIEPQRVTATLPNGAEISGTPDVVVPEWNCVLDIKTVDGYSWIKRSGTSQNHKFQRHLYVMGAVAAGLLDGSRPLYVGNIYFDRSGNEKSCYVTVEEFDPTLTDEITSWVDDVIYAVQHDEDAMRDIAAPVCEKICEFFGECRGGLPTAEGERLDSPEILDAVAMYVEGRDMESEGKKMKKAAGVVLDGVNGSTGEWQVRSTFIGESEVPGFMRAGYTRIDIRKQR